MSAYYNEHDPKAAAWLRELIAGGHIAEGVVDERSILEVKPHELYGYTQHHFFAGIGGWSLALRLAGIPDDRRITTASLPCQPFSAAGKQEGAVDDRHLWPVFFDLARKCGFERIVGEQVAQAIGFNWLDGISADLEAAGYAVGSIVLGAHSVGAPHRRQRLYWVADASSERILRDRRGKDDGSARCAEGEERQQRIRTDAGTDSATCRMANGERPRPEGHTGNGDHGHESRRIGADATGSTAASGGTGGMGEPDRTGSQQGRQATETARHWHSTEPARSGHCRMDDATGPRRDGTLGAAEGEARDETRLCLPRAGCEERGSWDDYTIIPCRDGKARRIESGTFPLVDGLPRGVVHRRDFGVPINPKATAEARVMRLKGYGNAIVPELAAQFILTCEEALAEESAPQKESEAIVPSRSYDHLARFR